MNEQQIERELERLESMPNAEFRKMCRWFEQETRARIRDRQRAGQATQDDMIWLFEHAA